jgi:hypothetical protein
MNFVSENAGKTKWIPSLSAGFVLRSEVRNVGGVIQSKDTINGDVYLVAIKTITQTPLPIILSGGVRGTNAQLWGLGGNAPNWSARAFGAAGFVVKLPKKATAIFAAEIAAAATSGSASVRGNANDSHLRGQIGARAREQIEH